jgi:hypothetical protein
MAINTKAFIEAHLKIKNKKARIVPLILNKPQLKLYAALQGQHRQRKPQRAIVLKARQEGISTEVEAIIYKKTAMSKNINSGIVAHEAQATTNLFNIFKRYHDNLEPILRPELKASNAKELIFNNSTGTGLNSAIKCMTAGNASIGRSDTFQNLHISEYAYWDGDKKATLAGLLQAVPYDINTMVVIESTANGYDDFKDLWDKAVNGENDFVPVFCAWWELEEYRLPDDGSDLIGDELDLMRIYPIDREQIMWRRWCIKNNCNGDVNTFKQEYPSNPNEAFLMSGRSVFDNNIVNARIEELKQRYQTQPYKCGHFAFEWNDPNTKDKIKNDTIKFIDGNGEIKIYEDVKSSYPYVIGGDTKGEGRDYYTATVINNITGNRAATMRVQLSESKPYSHQMYCLGKYYNDALIGIEMNFNTAPIEELERLNYPNQYYRERYDTIVKSVQRKLGWKTDGNTRPLIIDKEIGLIRDDIGLFNDIDMLGECITFVYDKDNRPDAISGKHDDLLLSDMIANEIRSQQTFELPKEHINPIYNFSFEKPKPSASGLGDKVRVI